MEKPEYKNYQPVLVICPNCEEQYNSTVVRVVKPATPEIEALQQGELNKSKCPGCNLEGVLPIPFVLYQPQFERVILFVENYQQLDEKNQKTIMQLLLLALRHEIQTPLQSSGLKDISIAEEYEQMVQLALE